MGRPFCSGLTDIDYDDRWQAATTNQPAQFDTQRVVTVIDPIVYDSMQLVLVLVGHNRD